MSGGPSSLDGSARKAAALAFCALACSSGVDMYRVGESGGSGGTVPAGGGTAGGAGQSGASAGGAATTGGAAGRSMGGGENGGRGAEGGSSGAGGGSSGAGGEGGSSGAGGAGGSSGSAPQLVDLDTSKLTDINAAAWGASSFFLLQAAEHRFWRVDPTTSSITGPFDLPNVAVSPHVFAASNDSVYIVGGDKVYRVPHAGSSTAAGADLVTKGLTNPSGAYAKGYFLIGEMTATSAGAQVYSDDVAAVSGEAALGRIYAVASDGSNFAFSTLDSSRGRMRIHDVPSSANMKPNDTPCVGGSVSAADDPISVFDQTVAWVLPASDRKLLFFASVPNGVCPQSIPDQVIFGGLGPNVVALINDSHALVVDSYSSGSGNVIIVGRFGGQTDPVTVMLGGTHDPSAIVVGGQQYAAIVADAKPAVIRF